MNWYIGMPIVAVKTHSQGRFKKGDEFVISGLRKSSCGCKHIELDVGIPTNKSTIECKRCGTVSPNSTNNCWFNEVCFAPLDQDISELTEILTTKQPFSI